MHPRGASPLPNGISRALIIFLHDRADILPTQLASLDNEDLSGWSIHLFIDAPRSEGHRDLNDRVRSVAADFAKKVGATLHNRERNLGLIGNITTGIDQLVAAGYESFLVLEDDIVLQRGALRYFGDALKRYKNDAEIGSISGFCYPLLYRRGLFKFKLHRFCSWGWAGWAHKWPGRDYFLQNNVDVKAKLLSPLGGIDMPIMLRKQLTDRSFNSWAVLFQCYLLKRKLKTIYLSQSVVRNLGWSDGVHGRVNGFSHEGRILEKYDVILQELPEKGATFSVHLYLVRFYALQYFRRLRAKLGRGCRE